MQKTSQEKIDLIVKLRKEGKTYKDIVELIGVSKGVVSRVCQENGLAQTFIELTPEIIQKCQNLYNEIGNIKIVAKQVGISYERLRTVIKIKSITSVKSSYEHLKERRKKLKNELIEYKGGKCQICGYDRCIEALEFHHLDPTQKDFIISDSSKHHTLDEMKQEVDKCILVCANCHREIHYNKLDKSLEEYL